MRFIMVLCFCVSLVTPQLCAAADTEDQAFTPYQLNSWAQKVPAATDEYVRYFENMQARYSKGLPRQEILKDVPTLRFLYTKTSFYTPFSDQVITELDQYAKIVSTEQDVVTVNNALFAYRALLARHIMNFEVLLYAKEMSLQDIRFGDSGFFSIMYDGLLQGLRSSMNSSGEVNGLTPDRAFHIFTYAEETYLLEQIGGKIDHSEIYHVRDLYYNVHDIVTKDGTSAQIYMDVTVPIRTMKMKKALQDRGALGQGVVR